MTGQGDRGARVMPDKQLPAVPQQHAEQLPAVAPVAASNYNKRAAGDAADQPNQQPLQARVYQLELLELAKQRNVSLSLLPARCSHQPLLVLSMTLKELKGSPWQMWN